MVGKALSLRDLIVTPIATGIALGAAACVGSPLLGCGAFMVIFFCLLALLQVVSREELGWLKGLVTKKDLRRS